MNAGSVGSLVCLGQASWWGPRRLQGTFANGLVCSCMDDYFRHTARTLGHFFVW
ncbi:hypothetical protein DPMN_009010 [Dreissena polymorpha]|uniref:Uncharacterized protein n=1 Tax=Dreissena polymorpha TaxID=45954 RepID=A0A9D4MZ88_DREPO|nr:hypothetical protein DPMN_009010 [Dreissena polymorpha]